MIEHETYEGKTASTTLTITSADIDAFAMLTGDSNPLHMDSRFAQERGFDRRVVHGMLLCGYVSRIFGMQLPGDRCLIHSVRANFAAPAYEGDTIVITVTITQESMGLGALAAQFSIINAGTGKQLVRGQAQLGLTRRDAE